MKNMINLQLNQLAISYDNKIYIPVDVMCGSNFFTIW